MTPLGVCTSALLTSIVLVLTVVSLEILLVAPMLSLEIKSILRGTWECRWWSPLALIAKAPRPWPPILRTCVLVVSVWLVLVLLRVLIRVESFKLL